MTKNNSKKPGMIYERIARIMEEMPAIPKDQWVSTGGNSGYKTRSIDQVYDVLHNLLAKHRLFFTPHVLETKRDILDRFDKSGQKIGHTVLAWLNVKYVIHCADDASTLEVGPVPGESMNAGAKSSSQALSLAMKYAILQTFCIPIEDEAGFRAADEGAAGDVDEVLTGKAKPKQATAKEAPKTRQSQTVGFGVLAQEMSDRDCNKWKLSVDEVDSIFQQACNLSGATETQEVGAWLGAFGQLKLITNDVGDVTGVAIVVKTPQEKPA